MTLRWLRPAPVEPAWVDLFDVRVRFGSPEDGVDTVELVPLAVGGLPLGDDVVLDAAAGGGLGTFRDLAAPPEPPAFRTVHTVTGRLALRRRGRRADLGLEATRGPWPSVAGELVVEDRLAATATLPVAAGALALSGFVASTAILPPDGPSRREPTGGGRAELSQPLARGVRASAAAEAARTFYPGLGDGADGGPALAWRARVAISVQTPADR